jgi:hypothetical protein
MRSFVIFAVTEPTRMRGTGLVARIGEMKNEYKILVGKPEAKREP